MSGETMPPQRRYSKLEEALEVKSLRRILCAYLNYSDAAEEDVRRYERSFRKLSPEHKALLSHLPEKYQRLRRCISVNSFFIMCMLQAFDPPFDISQYVYPDELEDMENIPAVNLQAQASNCTEDCNNQAKHAPRESQINSSASQSSSNGVLCHGGPALQRITKKQRSSPPTDWMETSLRLNIPFVDIDKVRCIIRNIVRDWALEGQKERDQCYKPILEELNRLFPVRCKERPPCCLIPGAGLGRLALEISCLGFVAQGNEFSYYMMICSSFILNQTQSANQWTIYPWIHSNCNSLSDDDQLCPVFFPDMCPASAGITEGFSMCAGDFVEVYNDVDQEASWDAVVTCFFLDTAHNIVEYIEVIFKVLKDGGVWINLGPLLYHFADSHGPEDELSVEISLEDVKKVAFQYGFELEIERTVQTTYTANPRSMMQNYYFTAFWTMKKKLKTITSL